MSRQRRLLAIVAISTAVAAATAIVALGSGATASATGARPLAATAGCGKAPTLTSGSHTIQSGGQNRSYIIRVPANYDNNHPYRLVFGFHWYGGTANNVDSGGSDGYNWSYYGLRRLADSANNGTIFVAPQGNNNGWANPGGQDVTFVDDMIRQIEAGLCVDTTQLYAAGFSYGGAMSYALACARPTVFRAVAVYSGASLSGCGGGTQPVAYLGVHGIRDNPAGGRALRDTFVRNNGCTPQNAPEPAQGSLTHIVTAYSGCRAGYPVVWAAFDGGHDPGPIDGCACGGWRSWTPGVVWNFFSQFAGDPTTDHAADHRQADRRQPVRPLRHRAQPERRHPGATAGLHHSGHPDMDLHQRQAVADVRQPVSGRERRRDQQRHRRDHLAVQRRGQPAMDRQPGRRNHRCAVRVVPGRERSRHGQRHENHSVVLQRPGQPAMEPALTVSTGDSAPGWPGRRAVTLGGNR